MGCEVLLRRFVGGVGRRWVKGEGLGGVGVPGKVNHRL